MPSNIEDYEIIGDGETVALVDRTGSLDWLCGRTSIPMPALPPFWAMSVTVIGGSLPRARSKRSTRGYRGDSLILETRFETADGAVTLIDFMPPRGTASDVVRLVQCDRGRVKMHMDMVIRFGFGKDAPWVRRTEDRALLAVCGPDMLVLRTPRRDLRQGYDDRRRLRGQRRADDSVRHDLRRIAFWYSEADRCRRTP